LGQTFCPAVPRCFYPLKFGVFPRKLKLLKTALPALVSAAFLVSSTPAQSTAPFTDAELDRLFRGLPDVHVKVNPDGTNLSTAAVKLPNGKMLPLGVHLSSPKVLVMAAVTAPIQPKVSLAEINRKLAPLNKGGLLVKAVQTKDGKVVILASTVIDRSVSPQAFAAHWNQFLKAAKALKAGFES
jgi:hypothetical protein